jgi:hypothetical protein
MPSMLPLAGLLLLNGLLLWDLSPPPTPCTLLFLNLSRCTLATAR